eukprot:scaffold2444_cov14-Tisochrysis_lutea.AAC.2
MPALAYEHLQWHKHTTQNSPYATKMRKPSQLDYFESPYYTTCLQTTPFNNQQVQASCWLLPYSPHSNFTGLTHQRACVCMLEVP